MPFTWTASKLWCKSERLPGQYERTLMNKCHDGLYMLKHQSNQYFPLFIACWITSHWNIKNLIYQHCYNFSQSMKFLLGISLQQDKLFCQHPSPGAQSLVQPGLTSLCAEPLGTAAFLLDPSPTDSTRISDSVQKQQLKPVWMWSC